MPKDARSEYINKLIADNAATILKICTDPRMSEADKRKAIEGLIGHVVTRVQQGM